MPASPERELLEDVYSAIGEILTDTEIETIVRRATGKDIYNEWANPNDPRKVKIRKTIDALTAENQGRERWVLTLVLVHAAAKETVRETIVRSFPDTLVRLPEAEKHVSSALEYLAKVLSMPIPKPLAFKLRPKKLGLTEILQNIVILFAYNKLHECLLELLLSLNVAESLLLNPEQGAHPNLARIAQQIDCIKDEVSAELKLLGAGAVEETKWVNALPTHANELRAAAGLDASGAAIDNAQRMARLQLWRLNKIIFSGVNKLSFDALTREFPAEIATLAAYKALEQSVRDLTATVLARVLKHKMWQEAEISMSEFRGSLDAPDDLIKISDEWFALRARVDWLANLEPDEKWAKEANEHAAEIDDEFYSERQLDEDTRMHFEAYRNWFRGPFKKIDQTLKLDCTSLYKMDDPLKKIRDAL
jgi:hypothetical protein